MRYLSLHTLLDLHALILQTSGGHPGVLHPHALSAALQQIRLDFEGRELYPTLVEKAAALGFFIILNHPFMDGNKRVGHALMETLLILNGYEIRAEVGEQEQIILSVAAGKTDLNAFAHWLRNHCAARQ